MRFLIIFPLIGVNSVHSSRTKLDSIYEALSEGSSSHLTAEEEEAHRRKFTSLLSTGSRDPDEAFRRSLPAVRQSVITSVQSHGNLSWTPVEVGRGRYVHSTRGEAERECGSVLKSSVRARLPVRRIESSDSIPSSFDSRTAFPSVCSELIGRAQDQSGCGSCWAFSTTTSLEDRLCIRAARDRASSVTHLSALDTVSCCNSKNGCFSSDGCDGGDPAEAWIWFASQGVVTGGENGDPSTCKPYPFPYCAHHVTVPGLNPCGSDGEYDTPKCLKSCTNTEYKANDYSSDKHRSIDAYSVPNDEEAIKREIMTNGPVSAAFLVYEDFLLYSSGIYQHVSGESVGGHAVKMIGWGEEKGIKYWLIVNSWNPSWGEGGLFRIKLDEGGIMDEITAGTPPMNGGENTVEIEFE
jgi:cathepsin B